MTTETKIKTIELDSNSLYKTQKIKFISDKSITTPSKTIPLDKLQLMHNLNSKSRQLNEIFKRFKAEQIKEFNDDSNKYDTLEKWFNSQKNKIPENTTTFTILDFSEERVPTDEEIEFLIDTAYPNSDITTIPTLSHFNKKQEKISYEDYKNYIAKAIETIEQLNHKPIMGIIPKLAPKKVEDLLSFYANKGINSFAIDLAGSNPISANLRLFKIQKILNKNNLLESTYLHGHNVGIRVNKAKDVIPAKDILGFGLGLSSLGEKRTEFKPNRAFLEFLKTNPENKFRLFNKKDYGYWKGITAQQLTKVFPDDCGIPINSFQNIKKASDLQKIFNAEQLALESHNLNKVINEDPEKTMNYIKKKKYIIDNDMKLLESGNKKIK